MCVCMCIYYICIFHKRMKNRRFNKCTKYNSNSFIIYKIADCNNLSGIQ